MPMQCHSFSFHLEMLSFLLRSSTTVCTRQTKAALSLQACTKDAKHDWVEGFIHHFSFPNWLNAPEKGKSILIRPLTNWSVLFSPCLAPVISASTKASHLFKPKTLCSLHIAPAEFLPHSSLNIPMAAVVDLHKSSANNEGLLGITVIYSFPLTTVLPLRCCPPLYFQVLLKWWALNHFSYLFNCCTYINLCRTFHWRVSFA